MRGSAAEWMVAGLLAAILLVMFLGIRYDPSPECKTNDYGYVQYCEPSLTFGE